MRIDDSARVTAAALAAVIGVSPRTVNDLLHRGVIEQSAPRRYDLVECVQQYVRYKATLRSAESVTELTRLRRAQAAKFSVQADELSGDRLPAGEVLETLDRVAEVFESARFPEPLAVAVIARSTDSTVVLRILEDDCRRVRAEVSARICAAADEL